MDTIIKKNIQSVREEVSRLVSNVEVVAVSKRHPVEKIQEAIDAGHRCFGENKVQEAKEKWSSLRGVYNNVALHMIGHLQTNKANTAIELFDVIESLDSKRLVDALVKAQQKHQRFIEYYIQVNFEAERQKGGVSVSEFSELLAYAKSKELNVTGVMCIPPAEKDPRQYFSELKKLADAHQLPNVSMGMSKDYLIALEEGATHIRVGTSIFGKRA
jgi:pyridoxal phosphate enzyme (YggS family)